MEGLDSESSGSNGTSVQTQTRHPKPDKHKMEQLKNLEKQLNDDIKSIDDGVKKMQMKELDEDERQKVIESEDFLNFFMKNTKIIEKALDYDDIFFEYGSTDKDNQ
jgi:hypothetical protein